jgi:hypothetical protein
MQGVPLWQRTARARVGAVLDDAVPLQQALVTRLLLHDARS